MYSWISHELSWVGKVSSLPEWELDLLIIDKRGEGEACFSGLIPATISVGVENYLTPNNSMQGIELVKTTLYHIERMHACHISMHATLESMFRKTHAQGSDWMGKIPFALVVLSQMPCQPIHCVQPLSIDLQKEHDNSFGFVIFWVELNEILAD